MFFIKYGLNIKIGKEVYAPYTYLNSPYTGDAIIIVIHIPNIGIKGYIPFTPLNLKDNIPKINIIQKQNPILHSIFIIGTFLFMNYQQLPVIYFPF